MTNIAGKAAALNVVTPSKPRWTWANNLVFMAARGLPGQLAGLLGLSIIHFARWVIIKPEEWPDLGQGKQKDLDNDYMIFCSNFNGTWDQYIDAFSDGIPGGLNLFWLTASKFPQSIPITAFKNYINHNSVTTDYFYNATPGSAQRDIKTSIRLNEVINTLAEAHANQSPEDFAKTYCEQLTTVQDCLGDPGFGPVASLDTERADLNRASEIERLMSRLNIKKDMK